MAPWLCALVWLGAAGCSSGKQSSFDGSGNGGASNNDAGTSSGAVAAFAGAGTTSVLGLGGSGNGGGATGNAGTAGFSGATTGTGTTQCNDGIDNDGDGLIDGMDPECTGPLDNDEGSFATGIPGDNRDPKWQDCFFDGNSGAGDDGCRYATGCLTGSLPLTDPSCAVTQSCIDFCAKLTPNGCDCFGCCTIQKPDGTSVDIIEQTGCSLANLDDTKACQPCTKSAQCQNTCGECELCPGKTLADLPASCTPSSGSGGSGNIGGAPNSGGGTSGVGGTTSQGGASGGTPGYTCDGGLQVCGPGLPDCPSSQYCSLGCCLYAVR